MYVGPRWTVMIFMVIAYIKESCCQTCTLPVPGRCSSDQYAISSDEVHDVSAGSCQFDQTSGLCCYQQGCSDPGMLSWTVTDGKAQTRQNSSSHCGSDYHYSVLESPWLTLAHNVTCIKFFYNRTSPASLDVYLVSYSTSTITAVHERANNVVGENNITSVSFTWTFEEQGFDTGKVVFRAYGGGEAGGYVNIHNVSVTTGYCTWPDLNLTQMTVQHQQDSKEWTSPLLSPTEAGSVDCLTFTYKLQNKDTSLTVSVLPLGKGKVTVMSDPLGGNDDRLAQFPLGVNAPYQILFKVNNPHPIHTTIQVSQFQRSVDDCRVTSGANLTNAPVTSAVTSQPQQCTVQSITTGSSPPATDQQTSSPTTTTVESTATTDVRQSTTTTASDTSPLTTTAASDASLLITTAASDTSPLTTTAASDASLLTTTTSNDAGQSTTTAATDARTSTSRSSPTQGGKKEPNTAAIAGGVTAAVIVIIVIVVVIIVVVCWRRRHSTKDEDDKEMAMTGDKGIGNGGVVNTAYQLDDDNDDYSQIRASHFSPPSPSAPTMADDNDNGYSDIDALGPGPYPPGPPARADLDPYETVEDGAPGKTRFASGVEDDYNHIALHARAAPPRGREEDGGEDDYHHIQGPPQSLDDDDDYSHAGGAALARSGADVEDDYHHLQGGAQAAPPQSQGGPPALGPAGSSSAHPPASSYTYAQVSKQRGTRATQGIPEPSSAGGAYTQVKKKGDAKSLEVVPEPSSAGGAYTQVKKKGDAKGLEVVPESSSNGAYTQVKKKAKNPGLAPKPAVPAMSHDDPYSRANTSSSSGSRDTGTEHRYADNDDEYNRLNFDDSRRKADDDAAAAGVNNASQAPIGLYHHVGSDPDAEYSRADRDGNKFVVMDSNYDHVRAAKD